MARNPRPRDEEIGEVDPDAPQAMDVGDEADELDTHPCPACGREIYEEAEQCPHCRAWVVRERSSVATRPPWLVITVIVSIALVLLWSLAW